MATVSGSIVQVTGSPDRVSSVGVAAVRVRPGGGGVITSTPDVVGVVDGRVSFSCLPGPAVLVLHHLSGAVDSVPILVGDGESQTLQQVVDAARLADDAERSSLEELASRVAADAAAVEAAADATGFVRAQLDDKADRSHTHSIGDVAGLQSVLDSKASAQHGHSIGQVDGLQAALNGKAASSHTHSVGQVPGLQAALDGKAASGHTHASSHITDSTEGWTLGTASMANRVLRSDSNGYLTVSDANYDANVYGVVNKNYVDAQDAKQLTASEVESVNASPAYSKVVRRGTSGHVLVPLTPTSTTHAVSKYALDAQVNTINSARNTLARTSGTKWQAVKKGNVATIFIEQATLGQVQAITLPMGWRPAMKTEAMAKPTTGNTSIAVNTDGTLSVYEPLSPSSLLVTSITYILA